MNCDEAMAMNEKTGSEKEEWEVKGNNKLGQDPFLICLYIHRCNTKETMHHTNICIYYILYITLLMFMLPLTFICNHNNNNILYYFKLTKRSMITIQYERMITSYYRSRI